jgi:hypothetical protein
MIEYRLRLIVFLYLVRSEKEEDFAIENATHIFDTHKNLRAKAEEDAC